jgi:hypothetical protein
LGLLSQLIDFSARTRKGEQSDCSEAGICGLPGLNIVSTVELIEMKIAAVAYMLSEPENWPQQMQT